MDWGYLPSTSSALVIEELWTLFAKFSLPCSDNLIVTDNGLGFTITLPSNGLNQAVQIIKKGLKKVTSRSINTCLAKVLLTYPLEYRRNLSSRPPVELKTTYTYPSHPNMARREEERQQARKRKHDLRAHSFLFCCVLCMTSQWLDCHITSLWCHFLRYIFTNGFCIS